MATLNAAASDAMAAAGVLAATDVTGYGLLGHLRNLLRASGARAEVHAAAVPLLPGALELARAGHVPGGTRRNQSDLMEDVLWAHEVPDPVQVLLADAQTSGGLLMAVPPDRVDGLLEALARAAPSAAVVGEVVEGPPGTILVL